MARILQTADIAASERGFADLSFNQRFWVYNGLDSAVTAAIAEQICPEAEANAATSYRFSRAMQGPALDMMRRGIAVNPKQRLDETERLNKARNAAQQRLDALATAVWGVGLNAGSNKQMTAFFYGALKMPGQYALRKTPQGKVKTLSCDHKALETLAKIETKGPAFSPYDRSVEKVRLAKPFVSLVTSIREYDKKLQVVRTGISKDGRLRCSYNVAGTKFRRWSSSKNVFNEGTNLQNITPSMRRMCCADDGYKLASPDLEQAESRMVAGLSWVATGDDTYWRACESGDLHTIVCVMSYPERFGDLGRWDFAEGRFIGDLRACREIADAKFYRHLSMRDIAKRIGHGSNYWGTPYGIAMAIGIDFRVVQEFQQRYFRAFEGLPSWHTATIGELQQTHRLTTPLGYTHTFFGRVTDDSTKREAIAFRPQSTIGEALNLSLYRVWEKRNEDPVVRRLIEPLLQVHDSIVFQFPQKREIEAINTADALMQLEIPMRRVHDNGSAEVRSLALPLEWKTGWNWASVDPKQDFFADKNPDGLDKYKRGTVDARTRREPAKPALGDWLQRSLPGV